VTGLEDAAMEYRVDDRSLSGETFLDFVQQVWPGAYNLEQTRAALSKTMNFTAWDGGQPAGGAKGGGADGYSS